MQKKQPMRNLNPNNVVNNNNNHNNNNHNIQARQPLTASGKKMSDGDFLVWLRAVTKEFCDIPKPAFPNVNDAKKYINYTFKNVEVSGEDSNTTARKNVTTEYLTLLHVAIQSNNLLAIEYLLNNGADITIDYIRSYEASSRPIQTGGFWGADGSGVEWNSLNKTEETKTCLQLAQAFPAVLTLLNNSAQAEINNWPEKVAMLIQKKQYENAIELLNKIVSDKQCISYHSFAYTQLGIIYLDSSWNGCNIGKAANYHKKAESRRIKLYYNQILNKKIAKLERDSDFQLKMGMAHAKTFSVKKNRKRNKEGTVDSYVLPNKDLTFFTFDAIAANSILSSESKKIVGSFDVLKTIQQDKIKLENQQKQWQALIAPQLSANPLDAKLVELAKMGISSIQQELNALIKNGHKNINEYLEATQKAAKKHEIKRQLIVENAFFKPKNCRSTTVSKIADKIINNRYTGSEIENSDLNIDMTKKASRILISAEKNVMKISIRAQNKDRDNGDGQISSSISPPNKNPQFKKRSTKENIRYGEYLSSYQTRVKVNSPNHQGNTYIEDLENYQGIAVKIEEIIQSDKAKSIKLAKIMIDLLKEGTPISTDELINDFNVPQNGAAEAVKFLTDVCVGLMTETFRRTTPADRKHLFPYAAIQARALTLAECGYILLTDLFKNHTAEECEAYGYSPSHRYGAIFGIATTNGAPIAANENIKKVKEKGHFINQFFNHRMLLADKTINEIESKNYCVIATREQIHKEMQSIYGGLYNTRDDDYSSDEEYLDGTGLVI